MLASNSKMSRTKTMEKIALVKASIATMRKHLDGLVREASQLKQELDGKEAQLQSLESTLEDEEKEMDTNEDMVTALSEMKSFSEGDDSLCMFDLVSKDFKELWDMVGIDCREQLDLITKIADLRLLAIALLIGGIEYRPFNLEKNITISISNEKSKKELRDMIALALGLSHSTDETANAVMASLRDEMRGTKRPGESALFDFETDAEDQEAPPKKKAKTEKEAVSPIAEGSDDE